jgi:hypothetical protein
MLPATRNRMQENITFSAMASMVTPPIIAGRVQARNKVSSVRRTDSVMGAHDHQWPPVKVETTSEAPNVMATPSTT